MEQYFTGYNDDDLIRPLCITFPQMIGYIKHFDSNKTISFKVIDNKLFKKYTKIWERVSSLMNIKLDSKPVNGDSDKYIKPKTKSYGEKINTNFQGKKIPKENALLEECKYEIKKNKMENLINEDLEQSSSNGSDNESDNGFDNESDNGESND